MNKVEIFNGYYTIQSPRGEHRTFRIHTQSSKAKFCPGQRIVGLLVGPVNTRDYQSFAFLNGTELRIWRKKRGQKFEALGKMLMQIILQPEGQLYRLGYRLNREGACIRCNRPLTTPQSKAAGYGPECADRLGLPWGLEGEDTTGDIDQ